MEFEIQFAHDGAVPGLDKVHLTGEMARLEGQASYLVQVEILKNLDGDLVIVPRPSITGEWRAEISGRARSDRSIAFWFKVTT